MTGRGSHARWVRIYCSGIPFDLTRTDEVSASAGVREPGHHGAHRLERQSNPPRNSATTVEVIAALVA
jgi:hypothetical protein